MNKLIYITLIFCIFIQQNANGLESVNVSNNHIKLTYMNTTTKVQEIFKDIPNYEGLYQVSNFGNIKSLQREITKRTRGGYLKTDLLKERILKPQKSSGRLQIGLRKDNIRIGKNISQLVAEAFLNHKPNGHELVVDHIDENPLNNRLDNLQIITHRENIRRSVKNKTSKFPGVHFNKEQQKWIAKIYINKKHVYLGDFDNEEDAQHKLKKFEMKHLQHKPTQKEEKAMELKKIKEEKMKKLNNNRTINKLKNTVL